MLVCHYLDKTIMEMHAKKGGGNGAVTGEVFLDNGEDNGLSLRA